MAYEKNPLIQLGSISSLVFNKSPGVMIRQLIHYEGKPHPYYLKAG